MAEERLLLGIDIGSTAVKAILMTAEGVIAASASALTETLTPRPGWVMQDPDIWRTAAVRAVRECLAAAGGREIAALSFSGHMSAAVLLDEDNRPVMPSILIADGRSSEETAYLRSQFGARMKAMTGNEPIDAFAASKLLWIKRHHPEELERTRAILFPKDYVRLLFTESIATDYTDAGNSLLFDPRRKAWDTELIAELGLSPGCFPVLHASADVAGRVGAEASRLTGIPEGTPVIAGGADMACSQLGTGAVELDVLAITLSTSAQVVRSVGELPGESPGGVTYHPSALPDTMYAMGSIFTGGLGVDWGYRLLTGKKTMGEDDYAQLSAWSEKMEGIPPGSGGLLFLPFLGGSGTPYFDPRDRASWLGLSTGQDESVLLHSIMEGVAYNIRESMEMFESAGGEIRRIQLGGGGSRNAVWCQMLADVLGKDVQVLRTRDAAAVGAALLAGAGAGCFRSLKEAAKKLADGDRTLQPSASRHEAYNGLYERYRRIYPALNAYYRGD
ncbi:hypothetical protein KIH86_09965 [Paenibacillus sp. HN-1]|uniref:xylulokinase n=1 Tax=Paenibacillus TaxID=44249 RepID=UPI001CA8F81E|nr:MULTISPECIES: FGGY family carbohydrate kinase [Paenibacillus]MBY9079915.1 hypothetical protein [Paenibacillus sp. CGMCC 1.18879]MBY9084556.1 hypothetical protein [Paenibacillus sinensis]